MSNKKDLIKLIEDFKVDLSEMKSELQRRTEKNRQLFLRPNPFTSIKKEEVEDEATLINEVYFTEKIIERLERKINAN
jgi:RNA polymerase-binding transcription factor DksA